MEDNVGTIVIGTKVNNKGLEKGIQKVVNQIKILEKEAEAVEREMENIGSTKFDLQKEFAKGLKGLSKTKEELRQLQTELENWENKVATRNQQLTDTSLDKETRNAIIYTRNLALEKVQYYKDNVAMAKASMQEETDALNKIGNKIYEQEARLKKKEIALERINNRLDEQKQKYSELIADEFNLKDFESGIGKIKKGFEDLAKKALKIGMALLGIRTIMNLITRSFNILSQYNTEIGNKMENLRLVLAVALEPIIVRIVNWLQTIMAYINYLTNAWFGLDLYARASELTTKKMAEDMAGAAGSAKEMRKQLAGFDEMNVLGDNVKGAGGGAGKVSTPEFNLDPNVKIPDWLKWIKDNGATVAAIIGAIGTALLAIKLAPFIAGLVGATESMAMFSAGLALIASGVVLLVAEIVNLTLNWEEMDEKQKALAIGLAALGAAMIALGVAMAAGFSAATLGIGLLVAAVIGFIAWITTSIIKIDEEGNSIKSTTELQRDYNKAKEEAEQALDEYAKAVENAEEKQKALDIAQQETNLSGEELNKQVLDGTLKYKDMTEEQRRVWKAFRENDVAQKELTKQTKNMNKEVLESQLAVALAEKDYDKYSKTLEKGMKEGILNSDEMSQQLVNDLNSIDDESKKVLVKSLPKNIKEAFKWEKYNSDLRTFKNNWNDYLKELDHNIKVQASLEYKIMTGKGGTIKGDTMMFAKGGILNIPKLATGAIINRPGAGVPVAGAIAGEAGREGVLPLTDYRAMEMLGREIGKWISINATIPVSVGNRQIARVMQELGQQSAFAKND